MVNDSERERSPSPQPCKHPKHPVTLHCSSCLIRARKIACCRMYPCHKHEDADDTLSDAVDAHERLLERRRELKKQEGPACLQASPRSWSWELAVSPWSPGAVRCHSPETCGCPRFRWQPQVSPSDSHRDEVISSGSQGHRSAASSYMASDG